MAIKAAKAKPTAAAVAAQKQIDAAYRQAQKQLKSAFVQGKTYIKGWRKVALKDGSSLDLPVLIPSVPSLQQPGLPPMTSTYSPEPTTPSMVQSSNYPPTPVPYTGPSYTDLPSGTPTDQWQDGSTYQDPSAQIYSPNGAQASMVDDSNPFPVYYLPSHIAGNNLPSNYYNDQPVPVDNLIYPDDASVILDPNMVPNDVLAMLGEDNSGGLVFDDSSPWVDIDPFAAFAMMFQDETPVVVRGVARPSAIDQINAMGCTPVQSFGWIEAVISAAGQLASTGVQVALAPKPASNKPTKAEQALAQQQLDLQKQQIANQQSNTTTAIEVAGGLGLLAIVGYLMLSGKKKR